MAENFSNISFAGNPADYIAFNYFIYVLRKPLKLNVLYLEIKPNQN